MINLTPDKCEYYVECCFRQSAKRYGYRRCRLLNDTSFSDGECHFRKLDLDGPNMYDKKHGRMKQK